MDKLLLIDGNSLTYRAYFGSAFSPRGILTTKDGTPVNAVLTLNKMLQKAIRQIEPTHMLIAFDKGPKTVRHLKLPSYKAGRQKTPDELIQQFPIVKEMISVMGIKHFELDQIEADDIIATLAKQHSQRSKVVVLSSDRDLFQLVDENISISVPQNGAKENDIITHNNFFDRFEYHPDQVKDVKGLVGDSSDNLPGVKGLGPKGAIKLLTKYKNLEGVYENIEEISGSLKEKLITDEKMAFLCKELATLIYDVEIPYKYDELRYENIVSSQLIDFLNKYELHSLVKTYEKVLKNDENTPLIKEETNEKIEDDNSPYNNILF